MSNIAMLSAAEPQRAGLAAAVDAALQARELIRNLMSLTQRGDPQRRRARSGSRRHHSMRQRAGRRVHLHVAVAGAHASSATTTGEPTPATGTVAATWGETILLVDDELLVRSVLRRLLERERYLVHEAGSADDAREFLGRAGAVCDLVILDQSMPGETGLHGLQSLRALTTAPFVLFSGMAPEVGSEVAAVLEKPALPAELYRVVREVLSRAR